MTFGNQVSWGDDKKFKIDKPIRLIELFSGIGSQAKSLFSIKADFEHHRVCEWDKYAVTAYNAIHGTDFKPSDITKITANDLAVADTNRYCYILTYSFPCTDLSPAGKTKGMAKGSGTRSGLLWEVERLLGECKDLPQILLMENVPEVEGGKNLHHFTEWVKFLESLGYKSFSKILNATGFGVPQNRERDFMVSILGDYHYEFPKERPLEICLADVLEDDVDEKYYLTAEQLLKIQLCNYVHNANRIQSGGGNCRTLTAHDAKMPTCVRLSVAAVEEA